MPNIQPFFHLPNGPILPQNAGPFNPSRTATPSNSQVPGLVLRSPYASQYDDEFDGNSLDPQWRKSLTTGATTLESYNDKIRSAAYFQFAASTDMTLQKWVNIRGDFSITMCASMEMTSNFHNWYVLVGNVGGTDWIELQMLYNSGAQIRSVKTVATVFSQVDTSGTLTFGANRPMFCHIQRSGNNWTYYWSNNGVVWNKLPTTVSLAFTVDRIAMSGGCGGAAVKTQLAIHFLRVNWLTLA